MKEIIGLTVFCALAGVTILLAVRRRIGTTLTVTLLVFSLLSGFLIVNHDCLQNVHGHQPSGEYTLKQIIALRNQALEDFGQTARREREALEQMSARALQEHENWVNRLKAVESVIESMKVLEEEIRHQEKSLKEHHEKLERGWNQVAAAYQDILDLALMSVKLAWLHLQARDEANAARSKAASRQMLDLMDQIVVLVLTDPESRARFYDEVINSLPPQEPAP